MSGAMRRCVYLALTSALLLVTTGSTAEGCSCERLHPQQHFCAAAYVIGGRILKREYVLINTQTQTGGGDPDPLPEVQPRPGGLHPLPDEALPEGLSPDPDGLEPLPYPEGLQPLPHPHPEGLKPLPMPEGLQPVPQPEGLDPLPHPEGLEPFPNPEGLKPLPMPEGLEPVPEPERLDPLPYPDDLQPLPQPDGLQPEGSKPLSKPEGFQPEGLKPLPQPEGLQPMPQPEGFEPLPHPVGLQPIPEELQPHPELPPLPLPEELEHYDTNTERVETPPITASSLEASLMATTGAVPTTPLEESPANETDNVPPSAKEDKEDKPHTPINPESMEAWNYKIVYTVKLKQIYKTGELSEDWKVGDEVQLETPASAGHCGKTTLKNDKNYLIAGRLPGRLNLCDWVQEHHRLTSRQKQGLKAMYGKYCDSCQILACPSRHCKKPKDNKHKTCLYDASLVRIGAAYNTYDCLASHSRCALRGGHKCKWQKNSDYHACEKRLP
ncbi:uncharacterized protein [Diadema antillarum]|uniref:uncharacterized protein n=1 Tax=Diadema antillarum TaxID=105358 RepID=UPI003A879FF7